jgi:hypothetical protein
MLHSERSGLSFALTGADPLHSYAIARAGVIAKTQSDADPASYTCVTSLDLSRNSPAAYMKTCGALTLKCECDRGQKWQKGTGCVDSEDKTIGNAYVGYIRECEGLHRLMHHAAGTSACNFGQGWNNST